jgi:hypothetical protein
LYSCNGTPRLFTYFIWENALAASARAFSFVAAAAAADEAGSTRDHVTDGRRGDDAGDGGRRDFS